MVLGFHDNGININDTDDDSNNEMKITYAMEVIMIMMGFGHLISNNYYDYESQAFSDRNINNQSLFLSEEYGK